MPIRIERLSGSDVDTFGKPFYIAKPLNRAFVVLNQSSGPTFFLLSKIRFSTDSVRSRGQKWTEDLSYTKLLVMYVPDEMSNHL